jgi:peptidoglycan/LPS O-acetylase OafA/YrhL
LNKLKYRSDIDGLRAVAVLSVILYHINEAWIPGGFLGVDVFFVISGYLITFLLVKDISKTQQLHVAEFYERRIKRIIPALLFMLLSTYVVGTFLLSPKDLTSLLESAVWSTLSLANIYFHTSVDTGYFSTGSDELPLLHLWSLGVEEQFYIVWPFAILLLIKYVASAKKKLLVIGSLVAASLILAQSLQSTNHSFAYYMLPTRAWELLAGSMVAFTVYNNISLSRITSEILSIVGIVLVGLGFVFVTNEDPVPGIAAVPTILGTSLLILSNTNYMTYVGRALSLKVMVLIGLVSYSAYLWHWPILAYLRYSMIEIDFTVGCLALVMSLLMATISYHLIEKPLRTVDFSRKSIYIGYLILPVLSIALVSLTLTQAIKNKDSWVYPWEQLESMTSATLPAYSYDYNCQYSEFDPQAFEEPRCVYPLNRQPKVILIGDSNAAHYLGMIRVFAGYYGFSVKNATQSSCPPVFDGEYSWIKDKYRKGCSIYRRAIKEEVLKYDTIVIGGSWGAYSNPEFKEEFQKTIEFLSRQSVQVIIMGKVPIMPNYNNDCSVRSIRMPWIQCSDIFKNKRRQPTMNDYIERVTKKYSNVSYFHIRNQVCIKGECSPYYQGSPLYYDKGHLSMEGSALIGELMIQNEDPMVRVFRNIKPDADAQRYTSFSNYKQNHLSEPMSQKRKKVPRKRGRTVFNIAETDDNFVFTVVPNSSIWSDTKVAFYLYKDNVRVAKQMYRENLDYILNKRLHGAGTQ